MITSRSVTGLLFFLNKNPVELYSKKQAKVDAATYRSEHSSSHTYVDQIVDLRITLRFLGVPLRKNSCMCGHNKYIIDKSITSHSEIQKMHVALSFYRVRGTIAEVII